ncbi:hypothetical protein DBR42_22460, partial [Pelomonas sp. HMWF004]
MPSPAPTGPRRRHRSRGTNPCPRRPDLLLPSRTMPRLADHRLMTAATRCLTMSDTLHSLSQSELLALALEASRREDAGRALAYLKEASARADASPQALFMLGSEYAQLGLMDDAKASMARAVEVGPELAIARFQLGMLHVTSGEVDAARAAWAPLAALSADHPQAYLAAFHQGMLHLVADEFDDAVAALGAGLAQNLENEALNHDMRRVIDAIE